MPNESLARRFGEGANLDSKRLFRELKKHENSRIAWSERATAHLFKRNCLAQLQGQGIRQLIKFYLKAKKIFSDPFQGRRSLYDGP